MIKKIFKSFQNKTFLKYSLSILIFLMLGCVIYLLKSPKHESVIKRNHNKSEIRKVLNKADILFDSYELNGSYDYFNKAQLLCDTDIYYIEYVYALTCMAAIEQMQGDFVASEILLTKTLPHLKKIKKPRFAANVYEQFGANYYYTYDYKNSLLYYQKALHLKTSSFRKITVLNSISQIYLRQKKVKLAESILVPLSKIKTICKNNKYVNDYEYARILDDVGLCYHQQGKPEAIEYYKKALAIQLRLKDSYALLYTNLHIAEYFQLSNPQKAQPYAKKAYLLSNELNDASNKLQSLKLLAKTSEGKNLKEYSAKFIQLADSIEKARKTAKNQFAEIKYYSKKDKDENLHYKAEKVKNELQLERQKNRNIISYIILFFTTMFSLFLYCYLTIKGKKEKNDAVLKSELRISNQLSAELTHDVYETLTFAENIDLTNEGNKEKLLNSLDAIYARTRNISKENSAISTGKHYASALKEMISGFKTPELNILLNGFDSILWHDIEKNKKIVLYRILQELFFNMKKHSQATLVSINFKINDKTMTIIYNDNGIGTKNSTPNFKNGLQNVENRIKTINGNIIFDNNSEKGFRLSFTFPL
ncbi:tetratricopeptide repeat protein [Flavobacterium sp. C3NV]|uniref:tetratricopeptide repeat-containing sensor histidine kinase n=1 Tax=Flavobacterium sp. C3NV TaxID=3393358 RepID=UPI00398FFD35